MRRGLLGQLDAELVDDAWIVLDAAESDLLHPEPAELWWTVVGRQRSDIRLLANYPSSLGSTERRHHGEKTKRASSSAKTRSATQTPPVATGAHRH